MTSHIGAPPWPPHEDLHVSTIDLDSLHVTWSAVVSDCENWLERWANWEDQLLSSPSQRDGVDHTDECAQIRVDVRALILRLSQHVESLRRASERYQEVEAALRGGFDAATQLILWHVGRHWFASLAVGIPIVIAAVGLWSVARPALSPLVRRTFSSRATVILVQQLVDSADVLVMGALGVPLPLAGAAHSVGLTSLEGVARVTSRVNGIIAQPSNGVEVSRGGGLRDNITVEPGDTTAARAPRTLSDLVERIPTDSESGAQIRVEEYGDVNIVYISGTRDSALGTGEEPWDMSSNLALVGGDSSASETAVIEAMAGEGISADDRVILVGHSQGGALAMRIAASGQFNTVAVVTAGAPIHRMPTSERYPVIAFEHEDDVVPVLGGAIDSGHVVYVTRQASESFVSTNGERDSMPTHSLSTYVETARRADSTSDARLGSVRVALEQLPDDGTARLWRAGRSEVGARRSEVEE